MTRAHGLRPGLLATHGCLLLSAALVLFPFLWIAAAAFKTQIALFTGAVLFEPFLTNYEELLLSKGSDYVANYGNSLVIGIGSTALVLACATLGAYSLNRLAWPAWVVHLLLLWSIVFHMIPSITMVGAWYLMFRTIGLYNTHLGLILAHLTLNLPIALWLMTVFVREVPRELEEAALIDGCTIPQVIWRVIVPLVRPGLMATGILVFIHSWNEFVVALNLSARQTATVPVAIAKFAQENEIRYGEMAAGAMLSIIPAFVFLLLGQRHIVRGLTTGAVK